MRAYVLVATEEGRAAEVAELLSALEEVFSSQMVLGAPSADVIAEVDVADGSDLARLVLAEVHRLDGVVRTETCVTVDGLPAG